MSCQTPAPARPSVLTLFDLDGTLMLTGGAGLRAMACVALDLFGDQFSFDGVVAGGGLDPCIFAEAALQSNLRGDHDSHHRRFRDAYLVRLRDELEANPGHIEVLPGVHEALDAVETRSDLALGILTGNYRDAAPIKLAAAGLDIDRFEVGAFGDEAPTRPEMVGLAMRRFESAFGAAIDPAHVVVIGDTPRDVDCAKRNGCVAFAVATGKCNAAMLHDAGADIVVDSLADPTPLLDCCDALSARSRNAAASE